MKKTKNQRGVGLVESMISLLLTSFIILLATQQYLIAKRQYLHLHTLLEQDFELQLVNDLLRDSVRRAGFTPCLNIGSLKVIDHRYESTKTLAVATNDQKDRLVLRRMSEAFTTARLLSQNLLLLKEDLKLGPQQIILIADCYHGETHQISYKEKTKNGVILKLSHDLVFNYSDPIYLGEWIEESYYVHTNQEGKRALYYRRRHAEELTDRINKISVKINTNRNRTRVDMRWGLAEAMTMKIVTEIRGG